MAAVRSKNSKVELVLRRGLYRAGVRYRIHAPHVTGRPDIVIKKYKLAIFVDGDFWHGNAWRIRGLSRLEDLFPTRTQWWTQKITANMRRDQLVDETLRAQGWVVVRVWESDLLSRPAETIQRVLQEVSAAKRSGRPPLA